MNAPDDLPELPTLISQTKADLESLYLSDNRPWVVAFSGGKDSTLVLQLVFNMLLGLGKRATKPIFVLSSDTQVEALNEGGYAEVEECEIPGCFRRLH